VPTLADLRGVLDAWFDPRWAEPWDAVGLVCGDPAEDVTRVLLAVDAVPATIAEALERSAQLLITHHPLLLTGVHGVPADDPKGALVHRMIRGGVAHFVAHTNADVADPGVSDALARRVGLHEFTALDVQYDNDVAKLVVFVPQGGADALIDAMAAAGAGAIGDYERCAWSADGIGTFRPLDGAHPTIGTVGRTEVLGETRVEMIVPNGRREAVVAAMRAAHPYEEPAFDLLAQVPLPTRRGTGRIGTLAAPMSLREFTAHAAAVLPATAWGVRAAGDPDRSVQTVAVSGGSGGSLAGIARRRGADVLLTADLKHHPTVEEVSERGANGIALVDAAHWATEAPWLDEVAVRLRDHFGTSVDVSVSTQVTDPWTLHESSAGKAQASQ
jgi:dinuclear metal center YbgI/SA1388 family protein